MTPDEAGKVVKLLTRPYKTPVDAVLLGAWYHSALEGIEYNIGLALARELLTDHEYQPKPADFNTLRRSKTRREVVTAPKELPEPWVQKTDEMRAQIQACREALRTCKPTVALTDEQPES